MNRYIVLSVNDNPDYLYFTPLTCWAWRKFGWEPILFYHRSTATDAKSALAGMEQAILDTAVNPDEWRPAHLKSIPEYRSDTITQMSRLYGSCVVTDGLIMTGDIDLIPLKDYWQPEESRLTVYGHDLTGYGHYPICFISAPALTWQRIMKIDRLDYMELIKRDITQSLWSKGTDPWEKRWYVDQDLITDNVNESGIQPVFINRGQLSNGYARGRVDRGAWNINQPELIDAHLFQQLYFKQNENKFEMTMELLHKVWPNEDFTWFRAYTKEFQKLTGHA